MDPISYGVAAKQKQRIEKVIAEPDSTSGVITVPQVIATGETITVPAGRTAVLPNVQVDGELVVDGEVFIPSGSSYTATNINVSGVGSRITGDFSNATDSSRVSFESNVLNSFTVVNAFPNGTGLLSAFRAFNTQSGLNSSFTEVYCDPAQSMIRAGRSGTGSYLPMTFNTNGAERMRIDTSGNVLVTGSGGLGYGTGSGGTVTQLTSKSTAVTLNKPCGQIIMNNASLAAGAVVTFILQNSLIAITDTLCLNQKWGNENYRVQVQDIIAGGARIQVENRSSVSQSEPIVLSFTVIKGATS